MQLWVALPQAHEETEPDFAHHPAATLPEVDVDGARVRVLVGQRLRRVSPVRTLSPLFYVEARLPEGTRARRCRPNRPSAPRSWSAGSVALRRPQRRGAADDRVRRRDRRRCLHAESDTRLMLLGGAPLDGERHLWWNFVSSSTERIEQAKRDWAEGRFAPMPGETEFIPLPDR